MEKNFNDDLIDITKYISIILKNIKKLSVIIIIFILLGVLYSFYLPNVYKSFSTFYPHYQNIEKSNGGLRNLAGLAGISLGEQETNTIPPSLYPKLISSISFKLEILNELIIYKQQNMTYREYLLANNNYNASKLDKKRFNNDLIYTTYEDNFLFNLLEKKIYIELNEKDGFIELGVYDENPEISAFIASKINKILQKNIIEFKLKNINEIYEFTSNQLNIAKNNLYLIQDSLANFRDSNKNIRSDIFKNQLNRIETEYNILKNIYNELAITKEKSAIDVKRNTPIFTIINSAVVPIEKFSPNRFIIILIFSVAGIIVGIFLILLLNSSIYNQIINKLK